ncbi:hypothetical protein KVR01_012823 [Diaporthe batatas]|uniref:uncharacterized protein n=1 Tax=Diaporthe batatas TaxID=748121 RepID=UPI001D042FCD|nr:uncharacterized protein KVR01_012823 [Diaporthe batatas]KAG8157439.1 hypothetical protein KVR01_012823 [Diaporthe batatas]
MVYSGYTKISGSTDSRDSDSLAPQEPLPLRQRHHSAPSLFRRRRKSSSSAVDAADNCKGSLGLVTLYEPSEARVDFVFVHGLHGGSRKTWSLHPEDPATFWPEQWLPAELGFKNVRIHSFGYDSDWSKTSHSTLRIRDFAQALVASIYNSSILKRTKDVPLVLVAHSMGGLVVKQAYILARNDPVYHDVASRIHSLYFLATPHRGSNSAAYLKAFLSVSLPTGPKAYAKELLPDSQTVADINEDFRHVCGDVQLWSFFEGSPTAGFMIVEKASAVMNLPGEHTQYLSADHRHVCKFRDMNDPNYITLRDCFKTTIEEINAQYTTRQAQLMKTIADFLDVSHQPSRDLLSVSEKLHHGTCEWITQHKDFHRWLDVADCSSWGTSEHRPYATQPRILWLSGPPGSGKSVTTSHVIRYLNSFNMDCCYFFFKNDTKLGIAALLLNLAYQMASFSFEIRQVFLSMISSGETVNTQDHTLIWNNLFQGRLFQVEFAQPCYWVIDGLDECPKKSLISLIQVLSRLEARVPVRIFITSRPDSPDAPVGQLLNAENVERVEFRTGQEDSLRDIAAYVRSQPRLSRILDNEENDHIVSDILAKSQGNFLWASLIIGRLDELYSSEDIKAALRQVPSEMNGFYDRILDSISTASNSEKAKCILKWVVCAPEPMSAEELTEAVHLDIGHTLLTATTGDIFSEICGSLVTVDSANRVQLMHQTVREYLISSESNFYVNYRLAHEQLGNICLSLMNGRNGLRRTSRRTKSAPGKSGHSLLLNYSCLHFSYHLLHSHSTSATTFASLAEFIDAKTLIWIEHIARSQKLKPFLKTIGNVKPYLARQLERSPPFSKSYQKVESWINDLTHIVSIFGQTLLDSPESIYAFIPPLCPSSTLVNRNFAQNCSQKIITDSHKDWEERLASMNFQSYSKSIAVTDNHIATGHSDGMVRIFSASTFEEVALLKHGSPVRQLAFGNVSNVLASCSPKAVSLWSTKQDLVWKVAVPGIASSVCFNADDTKLLVTIKNDVKQAMLAFASADGTQLDPITIPGDSSSSDSESEQLSQTTKKFCPEVACVSFALGITAVTWRSSHLTIFLMDSEGNLDRFCRLEKEGYEDAARPPQINCVELNPALESDLVAVAYQDGEIAVFEMDEWNPKQTNSYNIHTRTMASSPDGRTLAAGDNDGGIYLFVFETLHLLHRIESLDETVSRIVFSSSSLRLYDIRGRSCNVWEPPVLVRKSSMDDNSSDPEEQNMPVVEGPRDHFSRSLFNTKTITVVAPAHDGKYFFCGREDGSTTVHESRNGDVVLELKLHSVQIRLLHFETQSGMLLSVDISRRCILTRLEKPSMSNPRWSQGVQVLDHRAPALVIQAIIKPGGSAFVLSNQTGEEVWNGAEISQSKFSTENSRWMCHPTDANLLLLVDGNEVRIYQWEKMQEVTNGRVLAMECPENFDWQTAGNDWVSHSGFSMLCQALALQKSTGTAFLMMDLYQANTQSSTVAVSCTLRNMTASVKSILAVTKSTVIFLDRGGWICSLSIKDISGAKHYTRHFFLPTFWRTRGEFLMEVVGKNTIVIAHKDDAVIVHGFLDFTHKMDFLAFPDDDDEPLVLRRRVTNL